MKMKNLMQFEVKTYKGLNKNNLADDVIAFLNTYRHSDSQDKLVKYADMELTQFIRSIVSDRKDAELKDLEMQNLIQKYKQAS